MFKMKKLTVKDVCVLAMLIALTMVLSALSGYLRIGNAIKFSISFVSVYVAGALFGALWGGLVGAAADGISWLINPIGPFLWQLTVAEAVYGASYGLFFYRDNQRGRMLRVLLCCLLQFVVNMLYKTYVLMGIGFVPQPFAVAFSIRLPAAVIMFFVQAVVLYFFERFYIQKFRDML